LEPVNLVLDQAHHGPLKQAAATAFGNEFKTKMTLAPIGIA